MELLAYLGYAIPVCIPLGYFFARSGRLQGRHYDQLTAIILGFFLPVFMFFSLSRLFLLGNFLLWENRSVS